MRAKGVILTNKFVELIIENHQQITEHFMNDLLSNPETSAYKNLDSQSVYESGNRVYRELSKWITKEYPKEEIAKQFRRIGKERFKQGIPFSHAYKALVLLKRHLWLFVEREMDYEISDLKQALDLSNRVVLYFDRAAFYMLQGYEEMLYRKW
jgi:hypothetical protein